MVRDMWGWFRIGGEGSGYVGRVRGWFGIGGDRLG